MRRSIAGHRQESRRTSTGRARQIRARAPNVRSAASIESRLQGCASRRSTVREMRPRSRRHRRPARASVRRHACDRVDGDHIVRHGRARCRTRSRYACHARTPPTAAIARIPSLARAARAHRRRAGSRWRTANRFRLRAAPRLASACDSRERAPADVRTDSYGNWQLSESHRHSYARHRSRPQKGRSSSNVVSPQKDAR